MSIVTRITSIEEHIGDIYDTLELGGAFLLPKGYTQLEYIESTGTQYIDTGIAPDNTVEFDVTFNTSNQLSYVNYGCIFGSRESAVVKELQLNSYSDSGFQGTFRFGNNGNYNAYISRLTKVNVKLENSKYYVDGVEKLTMDKTFTSTYNLYIFAINQSNTASQFGTLKLYKFKLNKNGSLVRNFVPCKNASNEVGLYDLVSKTFFGNNGTGAFVAGPVTLNKNLVNVKPILKQKYLDYMNNGTQEIWNNWEKVPTATGENVTLNNTVQAPMDLGVKGNTFQQSYTGKNLFNYSLYDGLTLNSDGTIKTTKYYLDTTEVTFKGTANTQYTISFRENETLNSTGFSLSINGTWINLNNNGHKYTFTTDSNGETNIKLGAGSYALIGTSNRYIQLEKSSTATSYEPYVGGTASPNPSFPSPIQNVTGDVEVLVQNKNLWDEQWELGRFDITTSSPSFGEKVNTTDQIRAKNFIRIKPNTSIYGVYGGSSGAMFVIAYDENYNGIASAGLINLTNRAMTTPSNAKYIKFYCTAEYGTTYKNNIAIIEGSTATTYTPHQEQTFTLTLGNIELCKIGDNQDYFYKENSKWYLYKAINKDVLDENNEIAFAGADTMPTPRTVFRVRINSTALNTDYFSNMFIKNSTTSNRIVMSGDFPYVSIDNDVANISTSDTNEQKINKFKTWLSTNNITLYYPLETPTSTEITDTTLISQLDAISNATSYNEQTNISGSSDELNPIFTVVALKNI